MRFRSLASSLARANSCWSSSRATCVFAQLKILRSEAEASGDGVRCLAIVVRRRCLLRPADEGQRKIVIGLRLLGIGCDLLPGGCDSLLGRSGLLGLSVAQQNVNRR